MSSRRHVLRLAGASLVGLAGCAGEDEGDQAAASVTPTDTTSPGSTDSPTTQTPTPPAVDPAGSVDGDFRWTQGFTADVTAGPVAIDGRVVVGVGWRVVGVDADSGEIAWSMDTKPTDVTDSGDELPGPELSLRHDGDGLLALAGVGNGFTGDDYRLLALGADGTERWRYRSNLEKFHEVAGVGDDLVVLGTHDDYLQDTGETALGIDRSEGSERWRADVGDVRSGAVGAGTAFVRSDGRLSAFDARDGSVAWHRGVEDAGPPVPADDRVYLAVGGELQALGPGSGEPVWTASPWTVADVRHEDALYVGGDRVGRLDEAGDTVWEDDRGGAIRNSPFGTAELFRGDDETVYALARADGTELWTAGTETAVEPVAGGDAVVVAAERAGENRSYHAVLDEATGESRGSFHVSGGDGSLFDPVVADGTIYAAGGGWLVAFEP